MSVLRGTIGAVESMPQALGQAPDGVFGAETLAAPNAVSPATFLNVFRSLCVRNFAAMVTARPPSLEFLYGRVKRSEEMVDAVTLFKRLKT